MKVIFFVIAAVLIGASAYSSYDFTSKYKGIDSEITSFTEKSEKALKTVKSVEKDFDAEKSKLSTAEEKKSALEQSLSAQSAAASQLKAEAAKSEAEQKAQASEVAKAETALAEVQNVLATIGSDATLETLPDKISLIEDDKVKKQAKIDELAELTKAAEKVLAASRADQDRIAKQIIERSSRIRRNSMEASVTAVSPDWGFAVIGAGANSGFTPQTELLVQRDGKQIARAKPSKIEPTQTIVEIDLTSMASGVRVQPGDRVILAKPASN